eukprot:TRINITY_DN4503_c0_g1_i2.p1 TRINITY_DN4503_c0_g1~~TRINITY_DN4503_c0_g1_i2.p1  ORF type:complete len:612 (-),score=185.65 TRINITY_DN4503_c0_g1_i2:53-1888(-)
MSLQSSTLRKVYPEILEVMPYDWRGTTFNNSEKVYIGREAFAQNVTDLILKREAEGTPITEEALLACGNAEDYLRVASNLSTLLELFLGVEKGFSISQTWTFASSTMPVVAVLLFSQAPVHFYVGNDNVDAWKEKLAVFQDHFKCTFTVYAGEAQAHAGEVVLTVAGNGSQEVVDGIVDENTLFIVNTESIKPADALLVRKRLATPVTSPLVIHLLKKACGQDSEYVSLPDSDSLATLYSHLQTLSGAEANASSYPVVFTAGLPVMSSTYIALAKKGGADILMCSTAYGGSSQLLDLLSGKGNLLKKHTFHIQGEVKMVDGISEALNKLAESPNLLPNTILFIEIPTNPDMKVPVVGQITDLLEKYQTKTGKNVFLVVDTTFAPNSQVLKKIKDVAPELPAFAYISLSKSVSGGFTTGGTLVANHTPASISLLEEVRTIANHLDTTAKPDQLQILVDHHIGVEDRLQSAYENAVKAAEDLVAAVSEKTGYVMPIKFVTPEQASQGFLSTTFSFNLPSPQNATVEINEGLAQKFVDLCTANSKHFKPCVSFGQDNSLVYATVPATSTQGAIKAEDKAKQAVGGVQLIRLSFPPRWERETVAQIFRSALDALY